MASNIEQMLEAAAVGSVALMDGGGWWVKMEGTWYLGGNNMSCTMTNYRDRRITHIIPADALAQYEVKHDN